MHDEQHEAKAPTIRLLNPDFVRECQHMVLNPFTLRRIILDLTRIHMRFPENQGEFRGLLDKFVYWPESECGNRSSNDEGGKKGTVDVELGQVSHDDKSMRGPSILVSVGPTRYSNNTTFDNRGTIQLEQGGSTYVRLATTVIYVQIIAKEATEALALGCSLSDLYFLSSISLKEIISFTDLSITQMSEPQRKNRNEDKVEWEVLIQLAVNYEYSYAIDIESHKLAHITYNEYMNLSS